MNEQLKALRIGFFDTEKSMKSNTDFSILEIDILETSFSNVF